MIESHLNWNTKKPKLEDVEGKMVIVECRVPYTTSMVFCASVYNGFYNQYFGVNFVSFSVLSTNDRMCEWNVTNTGENKKIAWCHGTYKFPMEYIANFQVCPICGNKVRVVDAVPAPLSIAGIPISITYNTPDNAVQWGFATRQDAENAARTIESLLSDLATKMKGE
jgi:hypothetical protein